jgi:ribose 5-phosphate isomerase B
MIYIGSDHAGFELKENLKKFLNELSYEYEDLGPYSFDPNDDYPDYAVKVCKKVLETNGKGILICGTGQGMDRVANKIPGIYAAVCWDEETAKYAKAHGNTNVLAIGSWTTDFETAKKIVKVWLETPFSEQERHIRRINKIKEIEGMKLLATIKTRRSRRKYMKKEIPEDIVKKVIDSARYAPFGGPPKKSCQPWEFIIVRAKEIKEKLALNYKDRQFVKDAPVIIAVCADKTKDPDYKEWEITMGLAIENMLLTAHAIGLGACFVTAFPHHQRHKKDRKELVKALNIPKSIELIGLISLGYPNPKEKLRKKELRNIDEIIHYEKW